MAISPITGLEEDGIDPVTGQPIIPTSATVSAPAPGVDVRKYIMDKYGLGDKYSDEARSKLQEESQLGLGDKASAALMALGAGFSGRDAASAGTGRLSQLSAEKRKALEDFDKGRQSKIQDFSLARDATQAEREDTKFARDESTIARESDVSSAESQIADAAARKMGYAGAPLTAKQFKEFSPAMAQVYQIEQTKLNREQDQANKNREFSLKEQELGIKKAASGGEKAKFGLLPKDKQEVITTLAKDNAGKIAITNSIDSVLDKWDDLSPEEQLQQGRQLIKTLNSTQGKDAVGAEESKRLAGKLEFALGNISNDNPIQFGRDLEGFKKDAEITSKAIKDAAKANQDQIDAAYGRQPSPTETKSPKEETKVVGGKTYRKVPGGWEEVE